MFLNDIANALTASEVKKKAAQSRNSLVKESISGLRPGSDVVITGPVEFEGATGVLDSFSPSGEFVVVNLYNHGKKSFQRSDVSYNDYADSDQEEADMYDRDEDFRRSRSHDVDEDSWTDGQNAWSSDKNLWSESAEGGVFNVGDQVTYKGQPAEVIAVDGTAATVYVANWRAVPGMMDDTTEMDPASKFLTPLEQGVAENDDENDHGYLPTNLKLGAYRDEWDPRDYSAYPDEFKSNEQLREIVYNMVEEGVEPTLEVVFPTILTATQDWLADDRYRDGDPVFEEYEDHPVVLKLDGEYYILDGHHRCSRALAAKRFVKIYMFVAPQGMAEAGYAGADDTDTVGFHLDTERAYQAIMSRYGDMIDQDETSGIMYVPARLWPKIEMIAFDADGIGALRDDDLENPEHYGIAEAKHQPRWEVEQHTNGHHNAFYIVRGYDRPREVWKDSRGMSDFRSRAAAEAKAAELNQQGVAEGAKVDRMVKHIASSEKATGKSKKDAENIAWATANKRGYLDNKNKKKHVAEAERNEMDTPAVQKALKNMSDRHKNEKWTKEQLAALGKKLARPVKESYWDKLQAERSTKLNSLVTELSEAIKGKE